MTTFVQFVERKGNSLRNTCQLQVKVVITVALNLVGCGIMEGNVHVVYVLCATNIYLEVFVDYVPM